jgi:hypothetical protein
VALLYAIALALVSTFTAASATVLLTTALLIADLPEVDMARRLAREAARALLLVFVICAMLIPIRNLFSLLMASPYWRGRLFNFN